MHTRYASEPQSSRSKPRQKRTWLIAAGVLVVAIGWYLFRPELLFISRTVNEPLPSASITPGTTAGQTAMTLSQGPFHSVSHETKGVATVYQLADGKRVLRFTAFETSNGPDVQVYLVAAADANDNETVTKAGFISLGALKGTIGDQNYDVPANTNLSKYQAVTVWCNRFSVNFATAPLVKQ